MKILFTYLLVCICTIPLYAQEGWFSINHIANGNDMKSIYFINDSVGFTVSNGGYVFRTTNKGINWTHQKLTNTSLNAIRFKNNVGFIVGDSGKIFKTVDGINWIEKKSSTTNKLNAIYLVDADTSYAFGDSSTILKTKDIGETWEKINIVSGLTITDGAFPSADFGMCSTYDGLFLRTVDYGKTWQYYGFSGNDNHFSSIFFPDTSVGYAFGWGGDAVFLIKFKNKGNTVETKWPSSYYAYSSIYFVNADTGFIVSNRGTIVKTTDGGDSWNSQESLTLKNLNSVFFLNAKNGYACGQDSTLLQTTNGGLNWNLIGSGHTLQLMDVCFPTQQIGYAIGYDGDLLKTTDAGINWKIKALNISGAIDYTFESEYFVNADTGFIANYRQILRTTDGGNNWDTTNLNVKGITFLSSIKFFNDKIGIISATQKFLKTTDGGLNWSVIDFPNVVIDVCFIDINNIILIGTGIYKSTDGGNNWQLKYSNPDTHFYLNSVSFIDPKIGIAVGYGGTILRTTDGGENWIQINSNTKWTFSKIVFSSNSTGYIIGENGVILYTTDKGLSWSFQHSGTQESLHSIFFTIPTTGYIVGDNGIMLKTIDSGITEVKEINKIIPTEFKLYPNYPNPFNPTTTMKYAIPQNSCIVLEVYSILGEKVASLVDEVKPAGYHEAVFSAGNLSSGIYIYRLTANSLETGERFVKSAKMMLVK